MADRHSSGADHEHDPRQSIRFQHFMREVRKIKRMFNDTYLDAMKLQQDVSLLDRDVAQARYDYLEQQVRLPIDRRHRDWDARETLFHGRRHTVDARVQHHLQRLRLSKIVVGILHQRGACLDTLAQFPGLYTDAWSAEVDDAMTLLRNLQTDAMSMPDAADIEDQVKDIKAETKHLEIKIRQTRAELTSTPELGSAPSARTTPDFAQGRATPGIGEHHDYDHFLVAEPHDGPATVAHLPAEEDIRRELMDATAEDEPPELDERARPTFLWFSAILGNRTPRSRASSGNSAGGPSRRLRDRSGSRSIADRSRSRESVRNARGASPAGFDNSRTRSSSHDHHSASHSRSHEHSGSRDHSRAGSREPRRPQ